MPDFLKGDYATPDMFADTYESVTPRYPETLVTESV